MDQQKELSDGKKHNTTKSRDIELPDDQRINQVQIHRCPYCHDSVSKETRVICKSCLAPQHSACWDEDQRCGSCGDKERFESGKLTVNKAQTILIEQGYSQQQVTAMFNSRATGKQGNPRPLRIFITLMGFGFSVIASIFLVRSFLSPRDVGIAYCFTIFTTFMGTFGSWLLSGVRLSKARE
jgi:hypothetical protein